ncbi:MAG: alkaline phosphatase D family protein [Nitrospira sp.]|nr:alkaline phosphatase D family protein [Nitrospira sp.]MCP5203934.1 alkaline phosphatase D family protein [Pseudomonadales bacterium]
MSQSGGYLQRTENCHHQRAIRGTSEAAKKDKWCDPVYDHKRATIFAHMLQEGIENAVLLTGDMHTAYRNQTEFTSGSQSGKAHRIMSIPINQLAPDTALETKYISDH